MFRQDIFSFMATYLIRMCRIAHMLMITLNLLSNLTAVIASKNRSNVLT